MDRAGRATAALLTLLFLTACADEVTGPQAGSAPAHPAWTSCADAMAPTDPAPSGPAEEPRLGPDFVPVDVVVCESGVKGEQITVVEGVADDPAQVSAVVGALRLPDEPPTTGECTAEAIVVPWFALRAADRTWVRPGVPRDACRKPLPAFRAAFDGLRTAPVAEVVNPDATGTPAPPPAAPECPAQRSEMVSVAAALGVSAPVSDLLPAASGPVMLCAYAVGLAGQEKPSGDLTAGKALTAAQWAALRATFPPAAAAPACQTTATAFATLTAPGDPRTTFIELDGCHRVLSGSHLIRAGSPQLAQAVTDLLS